MECNQVLKDSHPLRFGEEYNTGPCSPRHNRCGAVIPYLYVQFTPPARHDKTVSCLVCVVSGGVNWVGPTCSTSAFCVGVRPAVAPAVPAPPDTLRRWTHLSGGRAESIHTATPDTTRRYCPCRVWCAGVNSTIVLPLKMSWERLPAHVTNSDSVAVF